jgi:hypothetical protein
MVSLSNWSPNQRATSKDRPTNRLIRHLHETSLWLIIALLLAALAIFVRLVFPGTEPTGTEILMGP